MTNRIKTVQNPRLILAVCQNARRISEILSDILNDCSYNTCIDSFHKNTDFIISTKSEAECPNDVIPDTIIFDESTDKNIADKAVNAFKKKVTSYEHFYSANEDEQMSVITYSLDNYSADVTFRNIKEENGITVFDVIVNGILGRVRVNSTLYSLKEVLQCIAVLTATGVPLAPITSFFNA